MIRRHRPNHALLAMSVLVLAAGFGARAADAAPRPTKPPAAAFAPKQASIVLDATRGEIIHAVNPDLRAYPASLTKMMTLYLTFDALKARKLVLGARIPVSAHAAAQTPSKLYLEPGDSLLVEEAILALAIKSANDASVVLAEAIGGTEANFARMMTRKARELGMENTVFQNASGLPNREQYTTARDLLALSVALYTDHPDRYAYFSRQSFEFRGAVHGNHNKLLGRYDGVDGIKTGFIRDSGFNLAASAERGGRRLFAVVLGGESGHARDSYMASLLDRSFDGTMFATAPGPKTRQARATLAQARMAYAGGKSVKPSRVKLAEAAGFHAEAQGDVGNKRPAGGSLILSGMGGWAIQVGAFQRFVQAQLTAARAARAMPEHLMQASVVVQPIETNKNMLYRARLVGLGKEEAEEACRVLIEKHQFECTAMAMPPQELAAAFSQ